MPTAAQEPQIDEERGGEGPATSSSSSSSSMRKKEEKEGPTMTMVSPSSVARRSPSTSTSESCCYEAVALMLQYSKVEFVRYFYVDLVNQPRCKVVPMDQFLQWNEISESPTLTRVAFATVVMGGLPNYGDVCVPGSGLDASGTAYLHPDLSSLRMLPYSPASCLLMGTLRTTNSSSPRADNHPTATSDLCTRSLLKSVLIELDQEWGLGVNVGCELEFCLYDRKTKQPVDATNFASTIPLNRCENFLSLVTSQLRQQGVVVELLHAESASGQFELVLKYRSNAVRATDDAYLAKETVVSVAHQQGFVAIFLPKTDMMQAGSGLHLHLSLYRTRSRQPSNPSSLQFQTESFVEGVLSHLPALLALTLPTANSFRRVGLGCWTGSSVNWAVDDKEAPIRVVAAEVGAGEQSVPWEHWEYKLCDATANLYLALSGIVLAGLHGLESEAKLRPSSSSASSSTSESAAPASFPTSVEEALDAFEADQYVRGRLPYRLVRAYLALRRSEAERAASLTLQDEVDEAFRRA